MERKKRKITLGLGAAILLTALLFTLAPGGFETAWKKVFAAAGLSDFSDQADSWPMALHVLAVGKADALVLECEERFMVVDGGTPDCGQQVCRYLKQRGANTLDYVVNTHPDSDHIGGLKAVLQEYSVERFLMPAVPPGQEPGDLAYTNVMDCLEEKGIPAVNPASGGTFLLGGAQVQVFVPPELGKGSNNTSLVLHITYGGTGFLLMGDAEKEEEAWLLESKALLQADVLKVGHHGSKTSTTPELLRAVDPQYAAVSVERDQNGLPDKEVLARLDENGVEVYRTDLNGTLLFLSDGKQITIKTER